MFTLGSLLANHLITAIIFLTIASFVAGFIDAIAGGAGLILLPSCMLAGMPPQLALGQEKLISAIGTTSAIHNYIKNKKVVWQLVPLGVAIGFISSYIGAKIILLINETTIVKIVIFILPIMLIFTLFKTKFIVQKTKSNTNNTPKHNILTIALINVLIGFYDGFLGPGTGSLFIIALYLFIKIDLVRASSTARIFNFSSSVGAFIVFAIAGKILFKLGIPMIASSLAGNFIGSRLAIAKGETTVKIMLLITVSMLLITLTMKFLFA